MTIANKVAQSNIFKVVHKVTDSFLAALIVNGSSGPIIPDKSIIQRNASYVIDRQGNYVITRV